MLERFSERARRVVVLATEEARRRGHAAVEPEHLLLGILRDGEGLGMSLLEQFGASRGALTAATERALEARPATGGPVAMSDTLKAVLEQAFAFDPGHLRRRVGTEHLVGALLASERSPAFAILLDAGTHADRARRMLGLGRRLFGRPSDEAVHLIATSPWRVRI
jgi:ATP-dependent Clp protease ATP-binding subunit ClpC